MRNIILKTQAWLNAIALLLSACMIDSESWIPFIIFCVSLAWLTLFAYANEWQDDSYFEEEKKVMAITRNDLLFIEAAVNAGLSQDVSSDVEYASIYRNGDASVMVEYSNMGSYTRHRKVVTTRDKSFLQTLLAIVAAVREIRKEAKS